VGVILTKFSSICNLLKPATNFYGIKKAHTLKHELLAPNRKRQCDLKKPDYTGFWGA
jgi:hypothetical protein